MKSDVRANTDPMRAWLELLPPSREQSLALTKLDECEMWAEKALEKYPVETKVEHVDITVNGEILPKARKMWAKQVYGVNEFEHHVTIFVNDKSIVTPNKKFTYQDIVSAAGFAKGSLPTISWSDRYGKGRLILLRAYQRGRNRIRTGS